MEIDDCVVCGGRSFARTRLLPELAVLRCEQCGFRISELDQGRPVVPEFSRVHDAAYDRSVGATRRGQARGIVHRVLPYVSAGSSWLDVGCSFGYLLQEARDAGFVVSGLEPDPKAAEQARQLLGQDAVLQRELDEDAAPDGAATIISALDVIEHLAPANLVSFAGLVHRKLESRGLWIVKVPSDDGFYFSLAHALLPFARSTMRGAIERLWQTTYEYPHRVYFNEATLRRFLIRHGFEVLASEYLVEVPLSTVFSRIRMDDSIPSWQAWAALPVVALVNGFDRMRRRTDTILVVARRSN